MVPLFFVKINSNKVHRKHLYNDFNNYKSKFIGKKSKKTVNLKKIQ